MTATSELAAAPREIIGKSSRRLARAGQIPAVLYGRGRDAMAIAVDRHDFELFMSHHAAGAALVELKLEGEKKPVNAMVREVQRSPIKGNVLHIDFVAVSMTEKVARCRADAPVERPRRSQGRRHSHHQHARTQHRSAAGRSSRVHRMGRRRAGDRRHAAALRRSRRPRASGCSTTPRPSSRPCRFRVSRSKRSKRSKRLQSPRSSARRTRKRSSVRMLLVCVVRTP